MPRDAASQGRLLLVDAEPATRWAVARALQGWEIRTGLADAASAADPGPDLVLAAFPAASDDAVERARQLRASHPGVPLVLLDGSGEGCAAAMRVGAFDCLCTPIEPDALLLAAQRALEWRRLQLDNQRLGDALELLRRRDEAAGGRALRTKPCELLSCALRERLSLRELEDRYVDSVLRLTGGNKVRASQILGIGRRTLYRREERRRGPDDETTLA